MESLGATVKFNPHFSVEWDNSTVLVAFSITTPRACTGMFSCLNDTFEFSKTAKNTNRTCITST